MEQLLTKVKDELEKDFKCSDMESPQINTRPILAAKAASY